MTSRLVQLLARYIAVGLTALAGAIGAEEYATGVEDLSRSLALAIVAIGLFLVDLIIHKLGTGGVLTKPGDQTPAKASSGSAYLLACVLLLPMGMSGCEALASAPSSPMTNALILRDGYTATMNILTTYRSIGDISDEQALDIEAVRVVAAQAIDSYEQAAREGASESVLQQHLATVNAALDRLIAWRIELETSHDRTRNSGTDPGVDRSGVVPGTPGRDAQPRAARPDTGRDRPGQSAATGRRDQVVVAAAKRNSQAVKHFRGIYLAMGRPADACDRLIALFLPGGGPLRPVPRAAFC